MLRKFIDRLIFGGYESAKDDATTRIVARYSRGNTTIQNGYILDEDGLRRLRAKGDKAARSLAKRAPVRQRARPA